MCALGMASQRAKVAGAIIGFDFAGTVERIGPEVPQGLRTIGERVAGWIVAGLLSSRIISELYYMAFLFKVTPPTALLLST